MYLTVSFEVLPSGWELVPRWWDNVGRRGTDGPWWVESTFAWLFLRLDLYLG